MNVGKNMILQGISMKLVYLDSIGGVGLGIVNAGCIVCTILQAVGSQGVILNMVKHCTSITLVVL